MDFVKLMRLMTPSKSREIKDRRERGESADLQDQQYSYTEDFSLHRDNQHLLKRWTSTSIAVPKLLTIAKTRRSRSLYNAASFVV